MEKLQAVRVGQLPAPDGAFSPFRANRQGALVVDGSMRDAAERGRLWSVANQAAVATTAGLATTWTGLGISNPATSGVDVIVMEFGAGLNVVASDEGVLGLMTSDTTGFADSLTAKNAKGGTSSGDSKIYCDAGATIATPILERILGMYGTGAITTWNMSGPGIHKLDGGIIVPPGRSLMTFTGTATTAAFFFHFTWEEVPV